MKTMSVPCTAGIEKRTEANFTFSSLPRLRKKMPITEDASFKSDVPMEIQQIEKKS
jgi:hypothetical protein